MQTALSHFRQLFYKANKAALQKASKFTLPHIREHILDTSSKNRCRLLPDDVVLLHWLDRLCCHVSEFVCCVKELWDCLSTRLSEW